MQTKDNRDVNSQIKNSNTWDYKVQPISVKLTEKIEEQLNYIADKTQMSRSNIIRYSITELYRKMKLEAGDD